MKTPTDDKILELSMKKYLFPFKFICNSPSNTITVKCLLPHTLLIRHSLTLSFHFVQKISPKWENRKDNSTINPLKFTFYLSKFIVSVTQFSKQFKRRHTKGLGCDSLLWLDWIGSQCFRFGYFYVFIYRWRLFVSYLWHWYISFNYFSFEKKKKVVQRLRQRYQLGPNAILVTADNIGLYRRVNT